MKINRDVRRQLRIVVGGLMGSGKSTLCRMLADLLDGVWVNQDEFAHRGKGAQFAFTNEIKIQSQDRKVLVLIADKINTMRMHREGILDAMSSGVAGDVIFVQVAHPQDQPGQLIHQAALCLSRIQARGAGHRTLMGDDPKLQKIISMTVGGAEPMGPDELAKFNGYFIVDMTLPSKQGVMQLLADLDNEGLLGRFHVEDLVTQDRLQQALEATQKAEAHLAEHPSQANEAPKQEQSVAKGARRKGKDKNGQKYDKGGETSYNKKAENNNKKKPPSVIFYELELDETTRAAVRELWAPLADGAPELRSSPGLHITLLYLGGRSDQQIASKYPHLQGADIACMREYLANCCGKEVKFEVEAVAWDGRIAAAQIAPLPAELCANRIPHITLALKTGVPPSMSNEILARRATNMYFDAHLDHWLAALGLEKYIDDVAKWCISQGVNSTESLANDAAALAAALEPCDEDQAARVKTILIGSTPGKVSEQLLTKPLVLYGKVHARCPATERGRTARHLLGLAEGEGD